MKIQFFALDAAKHKVSLTKEAKKVNSIGKVCDGERKPVHCETNQGIKRKRAHSKMNHDGQRSQYMVK